MILAGSRVSPAARSEIVPKVWPGVTSILSDPLARAPLRTAPCLRRRARSARAPR